MENGMIALDSETGKELGFTSDRFKNGSYLWKDGNDIIISFIWSQAKGNFKALVDSIKQKRLTVVIPTPLGRMGRKLQEIWEMPVHVRPLDLYAALAEVAR